jgi:hypothetical protein
MTPPSATRVKEYANSAVPTGSWELVIFRVEGVAGSEALPPQPAKNLKSKKIVATFDTCFQGIISPGREAREGEVQSRAV